VESFVTAPVSRLSIIGLPAHTNALLAMIRATYWRQRRVALFLEPTLIQITHPLVDKGIAVQRIAAEMGITRGQVLAVGDGVNDKGLIEWAGFGVAVGNACDELKALANVVAPTNDEHGVAHVIRQYVTRKW
jgi:hydroxymethylpyrimidine pyrophosphatase-like HAD family hydrolase